MATRANTHIQLARRDMDQGSPGEAIQRAEKLADWLDDRFRIPGTGIRIGLDGILGLIPGVGDTATAIISTYLITEAVRHKLPKSVIVKMGWNVVLDTVVGAVPLVGDFFDFAWKANRKNAALLAKHLRTPNVLRDQPESLPDR